MSALTSIHVVISLIAIVAGLAVAGGLLTNRRLDKWTGLFLSTTVLTSATGYLFSVDRLLPSHVVGAISLVALAIAIVARYPKQLAGRWRVTYIVTALLSLYLNLFVLVAQGFLKVPALNQLAPTQSEPPFLIAQVAVLAAVIAIGIRSARKFHGGV
jgi:hypothetical protein